MRFLQAGGGEFSEAEIQSIMVRHGVSRFTARALLLRGINGDEAIDDFLSPTVKELSSPFLLLGMEKAVSVIEGALERGEKFCVYGDYDADGICASAILLKTLRKRGADAFAYIPSRHDEGYGLNADAIRRIARDGAKLIITVDNGIAAYDEIALCRSLSLGIVVTDHHLRQGEAPDADALVCPSDMGGELSKLCGAAVAYKLSLALGADNPELLGLCALATVADVVPLTGENRRIVARGLPLMERNLGLEQLMRAAQAKGTTEYTASFLIAPRINAAGRMGDPARALELLMSESEGEAMRLAAELDAENDRRRGEELSILNDAERQISALNMDESFALVLYGQEWNLGVVGIVASRLARTYNRPVVLLGKSGDALTGSGRSIKELDLFDALLDCRDILQRFGGHALAAGVTVDEDKLDAFRERLNEAVKKRLGGMLLEPVTYYEAEAEPSELNLTLCDDIEKLAPFGEGNAEPCLLVRDVSVSSVRFVGRGKKHLWVNTVKGGTELRITAFGFGDRFDEWSRLKTADAVVKVRRDSYLGAKSCGVYCEYLKESEKNFAKTPEYTKILDAIYAEIKYNSMCRYGRGALDKQLEALPRIQLDRDTLLQDYREQLAAAKTGELSWDKLSIGSRVVLLIFLELGFFKADERGRIIPCEGCAKRSLEESSIYLSLTRAANERRNYRRQHGSQEQD